MSISSFVGDYTWLIGLVLIGSFMLYKFVIQPIMNEDKPIEPTDEDIKTFGEKMQESMDPNVDF